LQRTKDLQESIYKYFAASREQSRINDELGAGHISNISKIQAPSPPFRDRSKQQKMQAMALFGCIAAALALAFVIELYFDRSLKRPVEVETRLGLPLFISIPRVALNGNGKPKRLRNGRAVPLLAEKNGQSDADDGRRKTGDGTLNAESESQITKHKSKNTEHIPAPHPASLERLRPFYETLRDRLISFFELKNLTHKPKLVAVTSCGEGAGVTTTAAGLAASLSETGDGNVLLVDMNLQQGAAHHFHKGSLACGLDDALEIGKRDSALVQDNLYVASESTNGDQLPRVLPKRFKHLVPRMRASDYDYIIFDMPPVSQISATPRLAGFMDMVFMVVESEKTDRDVVKRAATLLAESRCNLGVILNKSRSYVPKRLQQEL
jgi:Mrp family chromosome partitioning ATPase